MEDCKPVLKWNSTAEEAARLSVKPSWIWTKARAGEIPHSKVGKYYFFNPADTDEWLKNQAGKDNREEGQWIKKNSLIE